MNLNSLKRLFKPGNLFMFGFWVFFFIGLVSNYSNAILYGGSTAWLTPPFLSASIAIMLALPILAFRKRASKLSRIYWGGYIALIITVLVSFLAIDYFCLFNFGKNLNKDVIDIILDTNQSESEQFLQTYLSPLRIIAYTLALSLFLSIVWLLSSLLSRQKSAGKIGLAAALVGFAIWGYCAYGFIMFRNGASIPQYTSISRALYSAWVAKCEKDLADTYADQAHAMIAAGNITSANENLILCLVIGESHSAFHTSAYSYEKETFPKLGQINTALGKGRIAWFTDIITESDHTHGVMESVFLVNNASSGSKFFFPAAFKSLGYRTAMYDNQYIPGRGGSFLVNKRLSAEVFDERNDAPISDAAVLGNCNIPDTGNQFIILHITGSHYTYSERYPHDTFSKFRPEDYPGPFSDRQREILAHYDNSLTYTDYLLAGLLDRLSDKKAIVLYISDHGEEIFENGDYMGHGNSHSTPVIDYQIRVPMFIWASENYISENPDKFADIRNSVDRPGISRNTFHILLDLANEKPAEYDSTKSIINQGYLPSNRIVLHSIDFDQVKQLSLQ